MNAPLSDPRYAVYQHVQEPHVFVHESDNV